MNYRPWQLRVLEESKQLNDRLSRLRASLSAGRFEGKVLDQLQRQERVMSEYSNILDERIADFRLDDVAEAACRGFESVQHKD